MKLGLWMEDEDLDRISVKYRYIVNDESAGKVADLFTRALPQQIRRKLEITNKADILVFRELLSQLEKVGDFW